MGWQDRDYAKPGEGGGRMGGNVFVGGTARPFDAPPWLIMGSIITTLIVVNAALWILPQVVHAFGRLLYGWGQMQGGAVLHGQVWRLITAQYLHDPSGIMHVGMNMLVLHLLGRHLEAMWSWRRFFLVYTLSGLAGNVFFTVLVIAGVIDPRVPLVGASGCIYGILGVVAVMFPHMRIYIWGVVPMSMRTYAIGLGVISFLVVTNRGNNFGGEACHLAGMLFGAWWVWRGEALLMRSPLATRARATGRGWFSGRRRAEPPGFQAKVDQRREDAATVDRILRKVYEGGLHTLSDAERKLLKDATERQQKRERSAGRTDRL